MLAIPALLGEHVTGPYEGHPKPPLEVVVVTYDQEKHLRQEREDAWEDGRIEGERAGEKNKLKELIRKKLAKGKSVSEIADVLEEEEKTIQELIDELKKENI